MSCEVEESEREEGGDSDEGSWEYIDERVGVAVVEVEAVLAVAAERRGDS